MADAYKNISWWIQHLIPDAVDVDVDYTASLSLVIRCEFETVTVHCLVTRKKYASFGHDPELFQYIAESIIAAREWEG